MDAGVVKWRAGLAVRPRKSFLIHFVGHSDTPTVTRYGPVAKHNARLSVPLSESRQLKVDGLSIASPLPSAFNRLSSAYACNGWKADIEPRLSTIGAWALRVRKPPHDDSRL